MADLNIEINSQQNKNNNNIENANILCRCPEYYLIPSITMFEEENILKLKFISPSNHEFKDEFNNLYNKSKIDFENTECKTCNNTNKFYLCSKCNNFILKNVKMSIKKK